MHPTWCSPSLSGSCLPCWDLRDGLVGESGQTCRTPVRRMWGSLGRVGERCQHHDGSTLTSPLWRRQGRSSRVAVVCAGEKLVAGRVMGSVGAIKACHLFPKQREGRHASKDSQQLCRRNVHASAFFSDLKAFRGGSNFGANNEMGLSAAGMLFRVLLVGEGKKDRDKAG